ncbi:hypothetical protein ACIO3O_27420 [Streptomyces sp. NPDC087440]|uniref:hypothetical protein n=1 Tax=Streptomyces sp. NPDC087440 TaxID=3365790 RepID=UPI00381661F1
MSTATEPQSPTEPSGDVQPSADVEASVGAADGRAGRRSRFLVGGALLLIAAGAVSALYALTSPNAPAAPPVPTAAVTYSVTGDGTADITYLATSAEGTATTEKGVTLPWKKTVRVPLGKEPVVKVQLPKTGGTATCALAVREQHQQRATASGAYGRTTCVGAVPGEGR